jgi:Tfp pilus assembly protein FimT
MSEITDKKREGGWSLIELIFLLFIISTFLLIAIPHVLALGERGERDLLLHMISSELQLVQMEAVSQEKAIAVRFRKNKLQVIEAGQLRRETELPSRYWLKTNYPQSTIVFRQTGQVRGGTVQLYLNERLVGQIRIQVASGRPKVELIQSW